MLEFVVTHFTRVQMIKWNKLQLWKSLAHLDNVLSFFPSHIERTIKLSEFAVQ